jgi:hypothetical protein
MGSENKGQNFFDKMRSHIAITSFGNCANEPPSDSMRLLVHDVDEIP